VAVSPAVGMPNDQAEVSIRPLYCNVLVSYTSHACIASNVSTRSCGRGGVTQWSTGLRDDDDDHEATPAPWHPETAACLALL